MIRDWYCDRNGQLCLCSYEVSRNEWWREHIDYSVDVWIMEGEWKQARPDMMIYTQIHRLLVRRMKKLRMV